MDRAIAQMNRAILEKAIDEAFKAYEANPNNDELWNAYHTIHHAAQYLSYTRRYE